MIDYISTTEISRTWGISARRVALLCEQGRVPGSAKLGKTWLVPRDAEKPKDKRFSMNKKTN